jgi:hypothetical protein
MSKNMLLTTFTHKRAFTLHSIFTRYLYLSFA